MASDSKLYTLSDVSKQTGISMPTLQRYKKGYQDRIPSEGSGRKQRYPKEALAVFEEIKRENMKRRGRPRKGASGRGAAKTARRGRRGGKRRAVRATGGGLLSLSEIGRRTGISYPTLVNYTKKYLDQIPHSGSGRKRRYPPAAVEVFRGLRAKSQPGRPRKSGAPARAGRVATVTDRALAARVRELEKAQREVVRQIDAVLAILKRPVQVTIKSA
jgi:DNA-binding transcriptional MerR regulator